MVSLSEGVGTSNGLDEFLFASDYGPLGQTLADRDRRSRCQSIRGIVVVQDDAGNALQDMERKPLLDIVGLVLQDRAERKRRFGRQATFSRVYRWKVTMPAP